MTDEVQSAIDARQYRESVERANLLLASAPRPARARLHLLRLLAVDRGALGDIETREKEALAAVTSPSDAIDLRLTLGRIALRRSDFASALRFGVNMKALLAPGDKTRRARALRLEAMAKWSQGALPESITLHGTAAKLCAEANDALGEALALNDRGLVRGYVGDYINAIADHEAAQRRINDAPASVERDEADAQVSNDYGFALWNLARHDEALRLLEHSLERRRALADAHGQGITQNNIGNVHRSCGRSTDAIAHYEAAIELCKRSVNPLYEAIALNNLGQMSMDIGELALAESRLQDALSITQRLGDKIRQADNYGNLGAVYLRLNAAPRALEVLTLAVEMRRQLRDRAYLVIDQSALALALARLGKRADAEDTISEVETALAGGQEGIEQPQAVYLNLHLSHQTLGAAQPAKLALAKAREIMATLAAKFATETERQAFLTNVAVNREIAALG
jgi:tetratricopeptide (TPR) repeat protein